MNPFQEMYDSLWSMVERNDELCKLVKPNNREKFGKVIGNKRSISSVDLPELQLHLSSLTTNFQASSSQSRIQVVYTWLVVSESLEIGCFTSIVWELTRSLVDWDKILCQLGYVKNASIVAGDSTMDFLDENRNIRSWTGVYSHQIDCYFLTNDLRIQ